MNLKIPFAIISQALLASLALVAVESATAAVNSNVPPSVVVIQAVQRPGTTYMDIDYRVNDPDDATVQTAALAFVNGGTSLSNVIKISTLVEGTSTNIGSSTPANVTRRLTWNVVADWNTNFGNVQVEILAKDGRGLLPFHWITLPPNALNPEITINDRPIYDADLLPIWYWLIATYEPAVQLVNGQILGVGGSYSSNLLAEGTSTTILGRWFLWERFNIRSASGSEITRAKAGRYGFQSVDKYSVSRGFKTPDRIYAWGSDSFGAVDIASSLESVSATSIALGTAFTLLLSDDGITAWGVTNAGQTTIPSNATNVVAIAAGHAHCLALRADGKVVAWGLNSDGQTEVPSELSNVVAIAGGVYHSLALQSGGTVVAWGQDKFHQSTVPSDLNGVVAIAAGNSHNLALKSNGTVVGWGDNTHGQINVPPNATNVVGIAGGFNHSLALKADGTIVVWGDNDSGQLNLPPNLSNVVAIAGGFDHSLALKADGTIVVWGPNNYGALDVPSGLSGIDLIGVGCMAHHVVVVDKRTP